MKQSVFSAKRKVFSFTQVINERPEKIFPLLCPERETEWLDGWTYNMIYSISGVAEPGAVFSTSDEGEEDTVWIITKHAKTNYIVEFTRFTPGSRTCVLFIKVAEKNKNSSYVDICYTYTGLTDAGNKFIDEYKEEEFNERMKFWQNSMNYFIETGKTLKH